MLSGSLQRRFDRVLVYAPESETGVKALAKEVVITGTSEVPGGLKRINRSGRETPLLPSDHYGIRCTLEFTRTKEGEHKRADGGVK